ncbi:tyrosine-type recombinase/integrase [Ethanoligenens sp.]|uniref:tyrosine-type recombinase/integrase n=1 Tax=Ethanoligenens sp. TaxID=2099655 RepID=UPI0039E9BB3B
MRRVNTAVWMEKQKRWQINVQKDGIRKSFYSSTPGRNGQRECNKKADDWLDGGVINDKTRVKELFDTWVEDVLKKTTGKSSWKQYESYGRNWICPRIGHIKIGAVNEGHLQSIIDAAFAAGLSKKTLSNIKACMMAFIKYARINKGTLLLPEVLRVPAGAREGLRTILQPADLQKLFTADTRVLRGKVVYELYVNAFRFEVVTGLRPGEVIGMDWADINDNRANVKRSINRIGEETQGKNENALRGFTLTPLAQWILHMQKVKLMALGIRSNAVFPREDGERIRQDTYYKRWVAYRNRAGIAHASPYELRHTFVSIVKQLPEGLLKPLVGHSKDMDTYGVYSHEVQGDTDATSAMVQELFAKALGKSVLKSVL